MERIVRNPTPDMLFFLDHVDSCEECQNGEIDQETGEVQLCFAGIVYSVLAGASLD